MTSLPPPLWRNLPGPSQGHPQRRRATTGARGPALRGPPRTPPGPTPTAPQTPSPAPAPRRPFSGAPFIGVRVRSLVHGAEQGVGGGRVRCFLPVSRHHVSPPLPLHQTRPPNWIPESGSEYLKAPFIHLFFLVTYCYRHVQGTFTHLSLQESLSCFHTLLKRVSPCEDGKGLSLCSSLLLLLKTSF